MPVPSVLLPSLKVTVPVAALGLTVAVKVTDCPKAAYGEEELKFTVVEILLTVWVKIEEVVP